MKATSDNGSLRPIENCYIICGDAQQKIIMNTLPDISDSKSASYADETGIGRSSPFKNYSYSENRSISWTIHFMILRSIDRETVACQLRLLQSCLYPSNTQTPYAPPPLCRIRCGNLLAYNQDLCCVLRSYTVKFPTDVVWDKETLFPSKFDMDLQFEVVYDTKALPYASDIVRSGLISTCSPVWQ